jgi:hypothetical protein
MLKRIALAGIFVFASAISVSTPAFSSPTPATRSKQGQTVKAPSAPQPKGFCWPAGMPC